jgi:aspartate/methionine/tyrosine aminotransferase
MTAQRPEIFKAMTPVADETQSSPIRKVMKLIEEKDDILSLAAGEARFEPPLELIDLAVEAMRTGKNIYTSTSGIPLIREAVANFTARKYGVKIDPDTQIATTVGGMEAIYLATRVLVSPGDKVLLPDPGWGVMWPLFARKGATVETYPLKETDSWTVDADSILERMGKETRLLVINSPSNPTGAVLGREGFSSIIRRAEELGVFILSDEVYDNFVYDAEPVSALSFGTPDHVLVINSFSKSFAVTGWRLGYAIGHPWLIRQMNIYKETTSLCSFSIGQWAMGKYLPSSAGYLERVRRLCKGNMEMVVERLRDMQGVRCTPAQGGFYVFPDFSALEPSTERLMHRFLDGGVAVVPGDFFGSLGKNRVRIMFAANSDFMAKAMDRLAAVLR